MSRFNTVPTVPRPDVVNPHGAGAFSRDPRHELFLMGIANFVGGDTYYESAETRDARQVRLVREVTALDPEWVAQYARWLRSEANMRTVALIVAAEYVAAGGLNGRRVIDSVLQRADEPAEMVGYWHSTHGRKIPMAVKRGVADAARRLYTERNALRFDGTNKAYRWADVLRIAHPKPTAPVQEELFGYLSARRNDDTAAPTEGLRLLVEDRRLMALPVDMRRDALPDAIAAGWSWERLASWLPDGMDAAAWSAVAPNMGVMALLRNLRNFDEKDVTGAAFDAIATKIANPDDVRASGAFPLRFLSAWKAVTSVRWGAALEAGLDASVDNVPRLGGRTLILIDISGSMQDTVSVARSDGGKRGVAADPLRRWEAAGLFGAALARRAENADVYLFNRAPSHRFEVGPHDSVLRIVNEIGRLVGGGTDTLGSLAATYDGHDRVVILTDEQTNYNRWDDVAHIKAPVLTWNLAGYSPAHTPRAANWQTFGGLTDSAFTMLSLLDRRRAGGWPWDG